MFLDFIKNFLLEKTVKKRLSNVKTTSSNKIIKTVGILIDGSLFNKKEALVKELIRNGIEGKNIKILVFKNEIKKNETFNYPVFSPQDLSWSATFDKKEITDFVKQDFDLLINYYDVEKIPLMLISQQSKADFKVGFTTIDERLNHFIISINADNYTIFVNELFKYLKLFNKI